jgi:hypothetical protein
MRKLQDRHIKLYCFRQINPIQKITNSSQRVISKNNCGCSPRNPLPRRILMDETIGSTSTPLKHLNKLSQKSWRFRCTVTVEKRFPKRNQKETTLMRSSKPNWIGVNRNQHKQVTESKHNSVTESRSKLKSMVKCP